MTNEFAALRASPVIGQVGGVLDCVLSNAALVVVRCCRTASRMACSSVREVCWWVKVPLGLLLLLLLLLLGDKAAGGTSTSSTLLMVSEEALLLLLLLLLSVLVEAPELVYCMPRHLR